MSTEQIAQLQTSLLRARDVIAEQSAELERLAKAPQGIGTVLAVDDKRMTVIAPAGLISAELPKKFKVRPGDGVFVGEGMAITGLTKPFAIGEAVSVSRLIDAGRIEVAVSGKPVVALTGLFGDDLKEGDKIILDPTQRIVVSKLPRSKEAFDFTTDLNVLWSDIGGQEEAKAQMIEAVEMPLSKSALYAHYRKRPVKGVMLYGPPGCGKTLLAKAAATAVARAYGTSAPSAFMYVKGPELLNAYVGETEASIRRLFARARAHQAEHGSPAVIFIDEADALLSSRGQKGAISGMEKTVVPTFLAEMDGLEASSAIVILATNRPDDLDPAITRDGRVDRKVRVSRPTVGDAEAIFRLNFQSLPLAGAVCHKELSAAAAAAVFDPSHTLYRVQLDGKFERDFTLANLVSGSLIAGIADQACSIAMRRDIAANVKKPSGVGLADVLTAIDTVFIQNRDTDHRNALAEFAGSQSITNVRSV